MDMCIVFFFQAEDGIRDYKVTGVQTCALPIFLHLPSTCRSRSEDTHNPASLSRSEPDGSIFHHGLRYCDVLFLFFLSLVVWVPSFNALSGRHYSGHFASLHRPPSERNSSDLRWHFSSLGADAPHSLRECARECSQGRLRIFALNEEEWIICDHPDSTSVLSRHSPD